MPDSNSVYTTKREAINGLSWEAKEGSYGLECWDKESDNHHTGRCYIGRIRDEYIEFKPGHGAEYAEISECYEADCLESEE